MGEEKRRYFRWKKRISVGYALSGEDNYRTAFTEDISEIGLQLIVTRELQLSHLVRLMIEFVHDSVPIMAEARVVHVTYCHHKPHQDQYRVGLEFVDLSDFDRQRLRRNLRRAEDKLGFEAEEEGYAEEET